MRIGFGFPIVGGIDSHASFDLRRTLLESGASVL